MNLIVSDTNPNRVIARYSQPGALLLIAGDLFRESRGNWVRSRRNILTRPALAIFLLLISFHFSFAEAAENHSGLNGVWVINEELSDDTDKQVEKAIKAAGGKIKSKKRGKGRHRGGPKEHELYDRMSYDEVLQIQYSDPECRFVYADGFERVFYTDGRSRSFSARGSGNNERQDYSFADWLGEKLLVEARPRDGGLTIESYVLEPNGKQLRVELKLKPLSFGATIEIVRIYDRSIGTE